VVHVPWTCDRGPRRVDGLAKFTECGFVYNILTLLQIKFKGR